MFRSPVLEKIVLGHNPFFGVDHLSSQRGQLREKQFADARLIIEMISFSVQHGATGMMMSTHARSNGVLERVRHSTLKDSLKLYPLLPYAQKYVTAANEKGLLNVVMDTISESSGSELFGFLKSGAQALFKKDMQGILRSLMTIELRAFKGLQVDAVFLHDVCTDLLLALDLKESAYTYIEHIQDILGWRAAFTTKNLPFFLAKMNSWGISDPIVMTHVNKVGFSMNPSREAVEVALRNEPCHVMAMSSLASGFVKPKEAYEYLGSLGVIESVVVGASSKQHIEETFHHIKQYL